MQKTITLNGKKFTYKLKRHANSKRIKLKITSDGDLIAVTPKRIPLKLVEHFINQNSNWVISNVTSRIGEFKVTTEKKSAMYKANKVHALEYIKGKLTVFNNFYNFKYNKVTVKDQKSLWGSCSRSGNLNFNYRIAFLPEELCDYIIVHELCHLKEFNHSQNFWNLVALTIPNYKDAKKLLKTYEMGMF